MNRIFRNTAAVLVLTLFTGLAVFSAIQLGDRLFGSSDASAQTVTTQSTTSSGSVPATTGATDQQGSSGVQDSTGTQEQDSTGTQDSAGTTQTCPATGCSASSCHATE